MSHGFVNLIWNDDGWKHTNGAPSPEEEEVEEPIEGCIWHNVGWMRVAYQDVMVCFYVLLRDLNDWHKVCIAALLRWRMVEDKISCAWSRLCPSTLLLLISTRSTDVSPTELLLSRAICPVTFA